MAKGSAFTHFWRIRWYYSARERDSPHFSSQNKLIFSVFLFLPFKSYSSYWKLQAFAHAATCTCCSEIGTPRRTTASNGKAFFYFVVSLLLLYHNVHKRWNEEVRRYSHSLGRRVLRWDDVIWWKTLYKCPERIRLCSSPCLLQINKIHSFRSVRLFFILIKINVLIHLKNYSI